MIPSNKHRWHELCVPKHLWDDILTTVLFFVFPSFLYYLFCSVALLPLNSIWSCASTRRFAYVGLWPSSFKWYFYFSSILPCFSLVLAKLAGIEACVMEPSTVPHSFACRVNIQLKLKMYVWDLASSLTKNIQSQLMCLIYKMSKFIHSLASNWN